MKRRYFKGCGCVPEKPTKLDALLESMHPCFGCVFGKSGICIGPPDCGKGKKTDTLEQSERKKK